MLSIEECRKILSPKKYTDQQIEEMRDACHQLTSIMVEMYYADKRNNISLEERIKINEQEAAKYNKMVR
jgi:hypothetical protein